MDTTLQGKTETLDWWMRFARIRFKLFDNTHQYPTTTTATWTYFAKSVSETIFNDTDNQTIVFLLG